MYLHLTLNCKIEDDDVKVDIINLIRNILPYMADNVNLDYWIEE